MEIISAMYKDAGEWVDKHPIFSSILSIITIFIYAFYMVHNKSNVMLYIMAISSFFINLTILMMKSDVKKNKLGCDHHVSYISLSHLITITFSTIACAIAVPICKNLFHEIIASMLIGLIFNFIMMQCNNSCIKKAIKKKEEMQKELESIEG